MDNVWAFREVYGKARQIKVQQDNYCERALRDDWQGLGEFPEELKWEALVDVLRGRVKVVISLFSHAQWLILLGTSTLLRNSRSG